jgi:hypothetical protein
VGSQPPITLRVAPGTRREAADYDDAALERLAELLVERLAELLVERLAVRLGGLLPEQVAPLVDAVEIARLLGRTRSWVYEHAGELGAIRLGSGPRPRLGFSPSRVAQHLKKFDEPVPAQLPQPPQPRRRRQRAGRTPTGSPLLHVRSPGS